jgi:hypothetical protein
VQEVTFSHRIQVRCGGGLGLSVACMACRAVLRCAALCCAVLRCAVVCWLHARRAARPAQAPRSVGADACRLFAVCTHTAAQRTEWHTHIHTPPTHTAGRTGQQHNRGTAAS